MGEVHYTGTDTETLGPDSNQAVQIALPMRLREGINSWKVNRVERKRQELSSIHRSVISEKKALLFEGT